MFTLSCPSSEKILVNNVPPDNLHLTAKNISFTNKSTGNKMVISPGTIRFIRGADNKELAISSNYIKLINDVPRTNLPILPSYYIRYGKIANTIGNGIDGISYCIKSKVIYFTGSAIAVSNTIPAKTAIQIADLRSELNGIEFINSKCIVVNAGTGSSNFSSRMNVYTSSASKGLWLWSLDPIVAGTQFCFKVFAIMQ
jgi:hypothetical protein